MSARDSQALDPATSYEKIGSPVVHLPDFDGTVYNGDVGRLAANHKESHILGFKDIDDFLGKVDERRSNRSDLSRGSEKANIIEEHSKGDVEEIERILTESQDPDRVKTGFQEVEPELYRRGNLIEIVTAGVDVAAEQTMNGSMASVTGAKLKQNGDGIEVERYCGKHEKPYRVREVLEEEGVEDAAPIAVGDSSTDAEYMAQSVEAGGQSIAIEAGALDHASIDASGDADYETVSVLHVILDELYSTGDREKARNRAENYLEGRDYDLADVEATDNWNAMTLEGLSVYEEVKQ